MVDRPWSSVRTQVGEEDVELLYNDTVKTIYSSATIGSYNGEQPLGGKRTMDVNELQEKINKRRD
jgi:hypothetical protein